MFKNTLPPEIFWRKMHLNRGNVAQKSARGKYVQNMMLLHGLALLDQETSSGR